MTLDTLGLKSISSLRAWKALTIPNHLISNSQTLELRAAKYKEFIKSCIRDKFYFCKGNIKNDLSVLVYIIAIDREQKYAFRGTYIENCAKWAFVKSFD